MKNIYGTIGYTILKNIKNNNNIIVFADMHNSLPACTNQTNISEWFKSKFKTSEILLEEVPRDNFILEELWGSSLHTQQLKNLFLKNSKKINAVDIRPYMIPFSWEVVDDENNMSLKKYLEGIDYFFCLKDLYLQKNLPNYNIKYLKNTKIGTHYLQIKNNYILYLEENKQFLNITIKEIYNTNISCLHNINNILDNIMEWYICAKINIYNKRPIILHAGLAHSEKVIDLLCTQYKYKIFSKQGINKLDETLFNNISGCISLSKNDDLLFGGQF
jgi:hypothetical protein